MTAKLQINMSEGMISVEGDEKFVQTIYADFRDRIVEMNRNRVVRSDIALPRAATSVISADQKEKTTKGAAKKKGAGTHVYQPKVNPDLDLAKLPEFYAQFTTKNNSERILVFAVFIRDQLGIAPCSADDIYSCYFALKSQLEIPENMYQAFANAWSRTKWVQYISKDEIRITVAGENRYSEMTKSKSK